MIVQAGILLPTLNIKSLTPALTPDLHLDCKYEGILKLLLKHYRHVLTPELLIKDARLSAASVSDTIVISPEGSSINTNAIPAHQ